MKKLIFLISILVSSALIVSAQQFKNIREIMLPDSVAIHKLAWVDLDNDSLLDVLVVAATTSGKQFFLCYKNNEIQELLLKTQQSTGLTNAVHSLADVDDDNDIDIIVSGESPLGLVTMLMRNEGGFSFTPKSMLQRSGWIFKMADLDEDGTKELIVSGEENIGQPFLSIYRNKNNGWQLAHDSLKIKASSIEVFDFDLDGRNDLFVTGRDADNRIVTTFFYNENALYFKPSVITPLVDGSTTWGDLNHDGNFDIVLSGTTSDNQKTTLILLNHRNGFQVVKDSLMSLNHQQILASDFNSNGLCDIHTLGIEASGDTVNVILNDDQSETLLAHSRVSTQAFGDYDRDGDLDLIQSATSGSGLKITLYENEPALHNRAPGKPSNPIVARIFNRLFLYWDKPADDHTVTSSLTYDLVLQTTGSDLVMGEFDMFNYKRLTVSHGNNGSKNYLLLRKAPLSGFGFAIQSIDNSFHAGASGVCKGSGSGTGAGCEESITVEHIEACKNELIRLIGSSNTLWFSFKEGFMTQSSVFDHVASVSDTIFSVSPGASSGCAAIKIFTLKISETLTKKTFNTQFVCERKEIKFGVEPGWQVEWRSLLKGFISHEDSIRFIPLQNDTLKVKLSNGTGCVLLRNTALQISKPVVTLNGEVFQILKGEEVQLMASGGEKYLWSPSQGLSNDTIATPVASPLSTTTYVVTVTDTIGCPAQGKVLVMVERTAFVPNLFTPNEDGKNDELRIYGLSDAKKFTFTIHNREGSIVYETHDVKEATSLGWNGTVRGNKQPGGVYYWKVNGEQVSGRPLLINGKVSGSIVLIR